MLRKRSRSMMGGMVASPTPTVPISGDSMTVMTVPVPGKARARMIAAIQPAVPPPTITMRLIRLLSVIATPIRTIERKKKHRHSGGNRRGGARALEFALHAEEVTATAVIIGEWQVLPLQVGVLRGVGDVLRREKHTHGLVEVVPDLRIQLPVG